MTDNNKKDSALTVLDGADIATNDLVRMLDVSATESKMATVAGLKTGLGIASATLSRFEATLAASQTGLASGVETYASFGSEAINGTDLALNVDPTKIDVLTDGVYGATGYLTITGTLSDSQGFLYFGDFIVDDYIDAACTARDFTMQQFFFLSAGAQIRMSAYATSTGTWSIFGAHIWVQRLL